MRRNWLFVILATIVATTGLLWSQPAFADCVSANGLSDQASCNATGGAPSGAVVPGTGDYSPDGGAIYTNGPVYNFPGSGTGGTDVSLLQNVTLGANNYGFLHSVAGAARVADEFVIPAGQTWNITGAEFYAYQTGSTTTSTMTSVNVRIWNGVPGGGGTIVFGDTTTNVMTGTAWDNGYRDIEGTPGATNRPIMAQTTTFSTSLTAGTYWIDWQTAGTLASGPWAPPIAIAGQAATGNARQFASGAWANIVDTGGTEEPQGLPFALFGTVEGGGGGDGISLVKTVGTTAGTCATTDSITVPIGTDVYYCYEVTNDSEVTLGLHNLEDSELGDIFANFPYTLAPGASVSTVDAGLTISTTITTDTVNAATWSAYNPISYSVITGTCGIFPDISGTGTALNLSDDATADVTMPFTFQFFDVSSTLASVSNNGTVTFGEASSGSLSNEALPSAEIPNSHAVFWDDIDSETGNVYVGPYTSATAGDSLISGGTNYYAVQWDERSHFPGPSTSTVTFTSLYIAPGQGADGRIVSCYNDTTFGDVATDFGASATLGLNQDETNALQYSSNTARPELTGTFGIAYTPIGGGEFFTATDSATVTVTGPEISVSPATLDEEHPTTRTTTETLTIANTGDQPLTYTIFEEGTTLPNIEGNGVPSGDDVTAQVLNEYLKNPPSVGAVASASGQTPDWSATRYFRSGPLAATPLGASVSFVVDDGTAEDALGLTAGGQFIWFNRFTPAASDFPFTLTEIQFLTIGTSGCLPTDVVDFYVYQDADGDPANGATFVGSLTGQTVGTLDQFNSYPASIDVAGPGDVLIMAVNRTCVAAGQFPAAIDLNASQTRSWIGFYGGNAPNPPTLPAPQLYGTVDSVGFPGNWMIRGIGTSGCQAPADIPWLSLSNTSGTVAGGGSAGVTVTYNSTGLTNGTYTGNLCIQSNDFDEPLTVVPVTLEVGPPTAVSVSSLDAASGTVPVALFAVAGIALLAALGLVLRRR